MRNILAIGAYERDNFGDYLFLEVLKRKLPKDNILPGSVISSDMTQEYGIVTLPYDYVLSTHKVDAVWVVGGQIGGVDVDMALTMSLHDDIQEKYRGVEADAQLKEDLENLHGASRKNAIAYAPDLALYEKNNNTPLIINSVGLNETLDNHPLSKMKNLTFLNVRDTVSARICDELGIAHRLSPDVVSVISELYTPRVKKRSGVVFQINEELVSSSGIEIIKKALLELYSRTGEPITLLAAGLSYSHDSYNSYKALTDTLPPQLDISIFSSRKPLDIVDLIASSRLVVGTSLHVRIVASSYGIPRISLKNGKVAQYASDWDNDWPFDIDPLRISQALDYFQEHENSTTIRNKNAIEAAMKNLDAAVRLLPVNDTEMAPLRVQAIIKEWSTTQRDRALEMIVGSDKKNSALKRRNEALDYEINNVRAENAYLHKQINDIYNSKLWKILSVIRTSVNTLKRR